VALSDAAANPDATAQALAELGRLPALRRRRLFAAWMALLPRAARTGTPARPQIVPEGSAYSPSRQMWRDPQGNLYDATGAHVNPLTCRSTTRRGYGGKAIVGGGTVTDAPNDLPTEIRIRSAGAQRMALYRERRRKGLRCVMIELLDVEINMLIRRGWLARDRRADPVASRDAFHVMLEDVLR
jgi:hypothetical protein